jgi:hypothetical protein
MQPNRLMPPVRTFQYSGLTVVLLLILVVVILVAAAGVRVERPVIVIVAWLRSLGCFLLLRCKDLLIGQAQLLREVLLTHALVHGGE